MFNLGLAVSTVLLNGQVKNRTRQTLIERTHTVSDHVHTLATKLMTGHIAGQRLFVSREV
jgi:hypothetical protein